ncbi:DNA-binding response regulator [Paenibacillus sp. FSL H8-0548]|nr:DNA-binding response regulator [Paenibacillus sp. FSL H8-0548]
MYNVLVADDEPLHRRGITDMIKTLRPDYRVFVAKDGEEALRIIDANRIDILLTDIRMPKIDGLELIENLGTRMESIKVVILSVYGNFDYARQAIKLGAFDYLLKPLEQKVMVDMLAKLDAAFEKDYEFRRYEENLKQKLDSTMPVYEQHLLNRWMQSAAGEEELHEIENSFPLGYAGFVVLAKLDIQEVGQAYSPVDFNEVKTSFKVWMHQALQSMGSSILFYLDGSETILVSVIAHNNPLEWLMKRDVERLSAFIEQIRIEFGLTVSIGVGGHVTNLYRNARLSFEQARNAIEYMFYCGNGNLIFHNEIAYNPYKPALKIFPIETDISTALNQSNMEQTILALDTIIDRMLHDDFPSPVHLKESILYVLLDLMKANAAFLRNEDVTNLIAEMEFQIPACKTLLDIKEKARHYIHRIIDGMEKRKNNKNQQIIEKCMAHLNERYMQDLSLEVVAKKFFFSPAYFSSFFKAHTSMTFTEYLLRLRIDKAKELLYDGEKKVSEIALSVGFRDAGYFTRMFKRETGFTPEEFRKNIVL